MTARDELLAALTAERLDCRWFPTPPKVERAASEIAVDRDDEVTCARRRKALVGDDMTAGRWITRRGIRVWEASA